MKCHYNDEDWQKDQDERSQWDDQGEEYDNDHRI